MDEDLSKVTIRQEDIGNCYFLAAMDAILHHPQAKAILDRIRVEDHLSEEKYTIFFPSGYTEELDKKAIGLPQQGKWPAKTNACGIQMLELAYAQMVSRSRSQKLTAADQQTPFELVRGGFPSDALNEMLIGDSQSKICVRPLTFGEELFRGFFFKYPTKLTFLKFLREVVDDTPHDYILTTVRYMDVWPINNKTVHFRIKGYPDRLKVVVNHAYSIRSINLQERTITIANPHDTKRAVHVLPLKDFMAIFDFIYGIKIKKITSNANFTLSVSG